MKIFYLTEKNVLSIHSVPRLHSMSPQRMTTQRLLDPSRQNPRLLGPRDTPKDSQSSHLSRAVRDYNASGHVTTALKMFGPQSSQLIISPPDAFRDTHSSNNQSPNLNFRPFFAHFCSHSGIALLLTRYELYKTTNFYLLKPLNEIIIELINYIFVLTNDCIFHKFSQIAHTYS